jgi:hypothetical protein
LKQTVVVFLWLIGLSIVGQTHDRDHGNELSVQRIAQLRGELPPLEEGIGTQCSDRVAWNALANSLDATVRKAIELAQSPVPAWNDDDYLDFSRTGQRPRGEAMMHARQARLTPLVLAECATNRGTFVPALNALLDSLAAQPTWTLPAHDVDLSSFHHKRYRVELNAAGLSFELAETLYLLGDKLAPATREHVRTALEERIFESMRRMYRGDQTDFWLRGYTNWNAVCLSGVTGAALAALPSRDDRALFIAGAEHFSSNYLLSFSSDGYSEEGPGYWSYGFQHYALLREVLFHATSGKLDLFDDQRVEEIALFGRRFQMLPGVMADFGDAHYNLQPDDGLISYVDRAYGLHDKASVSSSLAHSDDTLVTELLTLFPNRIPVISLARTSEDPLRHYFPVAGVLVSKPQSGAALAITIKNGGNGGHSHNDIGSFSIALGNKQVIADPGGPAAYNASTFTDKRFTSLLLNSFGHPVPMIGGLLQLNATDVTTKVLRTVFEPKRDVLELDITKAYSWPTLRQLKRKMTYDRQGQDRITIEDSFVVSAPTEIEECLPTHGTFKRISDSVFLFTSETERIRVTVKSPAAISVHTEEINEYGNPFLRVGLRTRIHGSGSVKMMFEPNTK